MNAKMHMMTRCGTIMPGGGLNFIGMINDAIDRGLIVVPEKGLVFALYRA